jgi:hypothetical protein
MKDKEGAEFSPHLYPARIFINVDLPAPLGPMMAVKSPERIFPLIPFRMVLYSKIKNFR